MPLFRRRRADGDETTVFFATDLHGSEVCFRKFVAAAAFYGADLLVLGGDLTGKHVVPIVEEPDGSVWADLHGDRRALKPRGVEPFAAQMADEGLYPHRMRAAEHAELTASPEKVDALFIELMTARLRRWIAHARDRLDGTEVRIVTAPGNDDPYVVDEVIREHGDGRVLLLEGEVTEVAPGHEMLSTGWSNRTPWNTHREFDEDAIRAHIEAMAGRLANPDTAIFNIHVPPYDSTIDTAPALDERLAVKTSMGNQLTA